VVRVRPILLQRHREQAERALANVDLYLSLTRAYGLQWEIGKLLGLSRRTPIASF
jgi:hypothetical protein